MREWYDPAWAESWDAVGLVCGDPDEPVERVLLAVDAVPATVAEAARVGAQLLITHHPLLLTGVHGVPADDAKGALVHRMIRGGIAHLVAHTNADVARPGVSDALAALFGLTGTEPLEPRPGDPTRGSGRVGDLPAPMTLAELTALASRVLPAAVAGVRAAGAPERMVRRLAVCGGSGGSFGPAAEALGADAFLTADLKHHPVLEAVTERSGPAMAWIDAAHWATEAPWLPVVAANLRARFGTTVDAVVSTLVTDPWTIHVCPPDRTPPS